MSDRSPRWYSHARIRRYGWRTWYLHSPRIWRAGVHLMLHLGGTFGLGAIVFRDTEDDEWVLLVTLLAVELRFTRVRYWTKHEQRRRVDEHLGTSGLWRTSRSRDRGVPVMSNWTVDANGHSNSSHADVTARSIVSHLAHRRRFIPMTVPGAFGATVEDAGGGTVNLLVDRDTETYPDDGAHVLVLPFPEDS